MTAEPLPPDDALNQLRHSPSYRRADRDLEFLNREELRPVRLQLELLKPEILQHEEGIRSTVVVFGSARIEEPDQARLRLQNAEAALAAAPDDPLVQRQVAFARHGVAFSRYYDEAREFGRLVSELCQGAEHCEYVVMTGGGPGLMEAANRGAADVGGKSLGLNISLPHEQEPNPYITPNLCFQFRYFAIRKMHFMLRAKALVAFPGGFGTMDELFEALTLVQTGKMPGLAIVLVGRSFWDQMINWPMLVEYGLISPEDLNLFHYAETAQEAWTIIQNSWERPVPPL